MKTSALLAVLVTLLVVPRADAQQIRLQIQNGLVTLDAQNVSVRQILAEWARVGGAKIVNGEKVVGAPVTLQLTAVPERQALDAVLRSVSGYMLASRQTPGTGPSNFDRILILPASSAPRPNAPMPGNAAFNQRPMPVPQAAPAPEPEAVESEPAVTDDDRDLDEGDPDPPEEVEEPVVQAQPGVNPRLRRPVFPNPMGGQVVQPFPPPGAFPGVTAQPVEPDEETPAPAPNTPLNVPAGSSTAPGVIAPAPQQDPRQAPVPGQRRPPV